MIKLAPSCLIYLNFQPLEVVFRYRNPQHQVGVNYSYLFNLRQNILKSWCLNTKKLLGFNLQIQQIKHIKNDNSCAWWCKGKVVAYKKELGMLYLMDSSVRCTLVCIDPNISEPVLFNRRVKHIYSQSINSILWKCNRSTNVSRNTLNT